MHISLISTTTVNKIQGIYQIKNLKTGRVYIGQTNNLYKRFISHKTALIRNKHDNAHLQHSFNKHGEDMFDFSLLEICDNDVITKRELYFINLSKKVYNIREARDHPNKGKTVSVSKKARENMSRAKKGRCPENYNQMIMKRWKPLEYYIDDVLINTFKSAAEAARYFNVKPNILHQYIGIKRKTKKFPKGYYFKYVT